MASQARALAQVASDSLHYPTFHDSTIPSFHSRSHMKRRRGAIVQNKANFRESESMLTSAWKERYEKNGGSWLCGKQSQFSGPAQVRLFFDNRGGLW